MRARVRALDSDWRAWDSEGGDEEVVVGNGVAVMVRGGGEELGRLA